jgi:hypothetical protein
MQPAPPIETRTFLALVIISAYPLDSIDPKHRLVFEREIQKSVWTLKEDGTLSIEVADYPLPRITFLIDLKDVSTRWVFVHMADHFKRQLRPESYGLMNLKVFVGSDSTFRWWCDTDNKTTIKFEPSGMFIPSIRRYRMEVSKFIASI